MLDQDYSNKLCKLMDQTSWKIELPTRMEDFFQKNNHSHSMPSDRRGGQRMRARTRGVLLPEVQLPAFPREGKHIGIYTNDFSRNSFGIISPIQFWPEEVIRILLPTLWMSGRVVRVRYLGPHCFEIGCMLICRYLVQAEK